MIRLRLVLVGVLLALAAASPAEAQAPDPSSQDALNKTLQILLDQAASDLILTAGAPPSTAISCKASISSRRTAR